MIDFCYKALPWNVIFGVGAVARLPDELDKLGCRRALVLSTPAQVGDGRQLVERLDGRAAGLFDQATMHVPIDTVRSAVATAQRLTADCVVSIGGGSTTGLGKALALELGLPNVAVPTSYAGSEMTNIWGLTENKRKTTGRNDAVVPTLTLYDPALTLTMPANFAAASGMNAMAHAVANVAAADANPIVSALALEAIGALARSLPVVVSDPGNMEARAQALYGACLAGAALGSGSTGLHHRLCHALGGAFNTPHAETHAILLPHSVACSAQVAPDAARRIAQALGAAAPAKGLYDLARTLGRVAALKDLGVRPTDLDEVAALAMEKPLNTPEPLSREQVRALLENAYQGRAPQPL